jgi:hypothetical protein
MTIFFQRGGQWRIALLALFTVAIGADSRCHAESLVKMTFGPSDLGNMQLQGSAFKMTNDGLSNTPGDRDMSIAYLNPRLQTNSAFGVGGNASFTLSGMTATAPPASNSSFMVQAFDSGSLAIYNTDQDLLLSADLTKSGLQGALGPGNKQGLFLAFGNVTGGLIAEAKRVEIDSLQLRMKFPTIANGFSLSAPPNPSLNNFTTWTSSIEIMGVIIPEPSMSWLLWTAACAILPAQRRRRA